MAIKGQGINVAKNPQKSEQGGKTKFNIHVDPELYAILIDPENWEEVATGGMHWYSIGYISDEEQGFEGANCDTKCPGY